MRPRTEVFAPAKVNLTLHVTGRRADGYHLLDSLVVFVDVGDTLRLATAEDSSLAIDGPEAQGLETGPDNLVMRAAALYPDAPAQIELTKRLPRAAGIGGGSADAAACLRGIAELTGKPLPKPEKILALGADVPVCLHGRPSRMAGVGDVITALPPLPTAWIVLANPRVSVSTRHVFDGLDRQTGTALNVPTTWEDFDEFAACVAAGRNDMQDAAQRLAPAIGDVLGALEATGCAVARMSGSGATCYGLYGDADAANRAAADLTQAHPDWWVVAARILS